MAVGTMLVAFVLAGCTAKPGPGALTPAPAIEPASEPVAEPSVEPTVKNEPALSGGIALPSLDGLGLTNVGPPDDGPADAAKWLRKVTVDCPAGGEPLLADVRDASRWRGVALPRWEGQRPIPKKVEEPTEVRVSVAADGAIRIGRILVASPRELRATLKDILARYPRLRLVFDAEREAPWGEVVKVVAVAVEERPDLVFQAPSLVESQAELRTLREHIQLGLGGPAPEALGVFLAEADPRYEKRAPNACVRIRADAGAPYASVQRAMVAAMMNYIWRISLVVLMDGRETEMGLVYYRRDGPPARPPVLDMVPPELERALIVTRDETGKVFLRNEDEVIESQANAEDEISDIPLGGEVPDISPTITASPGAPGPYGFRTGGGRRRSAVRNGGSAATERCVAAAHAWLARNQEPDGRWWSVKSGGREGLDVAVTGLATLSLLGAGQTENRVCRHREVVRKAVAWLVANQAAAGCLAGDAAKRAGRAGTSHAIAGLAFAEAFGMARVAKTGRAAQRAVDYSVLSEPSTYGGGPGEVLPTRSKV
jgi:biopolymer transport protein ExbD